MGEIVPKLPAMPKVRPPRYTVTLKAALAELVAMTLFVYIGCGESGVVGARLKNKT